jgi:hypothetical protein
MMRQTFAELEFADESDRKKKYVMAESDNRIVLCGASAYEQKYYFNPIFEKIPKSIQDELRIICTLFTEEVGGVITLVFEEDGALSIDTEYAEDDFYYDEISSGLMVRKIKSTREELLESLVLYYRVFVKHEDINQLLAQEEE